MINSLIRGKFGKDVLWNISSLGILSVTGILINVIIGSIYGPEIFGVFNLVYTIYIIFSQVAVFGIHVSTAKHIAQFYSEKQERDRIISAAIYLTVLIGVSTSLIMYLISDFMGWALKSEQITKGILFILPGLVFFALNKVLLGFLNGMRYMKSYAVFLASRYILMILILLIFVIKKFPGYIIPVILSGSEVILFIALFLYTLSKIKLVFFVGSWLKRHLKFGSKSMIGGIITELNTRIDVLVLGLFTTNYIVGIYSFAAMFAEGFYQLLIVFRTNLNPILARQFSENNLEQIIETKHKLIKFIYPIIALGGFLLVMSYPLVCKISGSKYLEGWISLCFLVGGIIIASGYLVFGNILTQAGYPGRESMIIFITVGTNFLLNIIFVPYFNLNGAALATGLTFIVNALLIKFFVKHLFKISL